MWPRTARCFLCHACGLLEDPQNARTFGCLHGILQLNAPGGGMSMMRMWSAGLAGEPLPNGLPPGAEEPSRAPAPPAPLAPAAASAGQGLGLRQAVPELLLLLLLLAAPEVRVVQGACCMGGGWGKGRGVRDESHRWWCAGPLHTDKGQGPGVRQLSPARRPATHPHTCTCIHCQNLKLRPRVHAR